MPFPMGARPEARGRMRPQPGRTYSMKGFWEDCPECFGSGFRRSRDHEGVIRYRRGCGCQLDPQARAAHQAMEELRGLDTRRRRE